jgi:hypothetical protein
MVLEFEAIFYFKIQAELRVGDMILAVNTESFLSVSYEEVSIKIGLDGSEKLRNIFGLTKSLICLELTWRRLSKYKMLVFTSTKI